MTATQRFIEKAIEGGWKYDPIELPRLSRHTWSVADSGYLVTTIKYRRTKMHHFILGRPPKGMEVDHINKDKLDNRRENLRFVTRQQNAKNRSVGKGYRRKGSRWEAYIQSDWKQIYLGMFDTEAQAEEAYLEAKKHYHAV